MDEAIDRLLRSFRHSGMDSEARFRWYCRRSDPVWRFAMVDDEELRAKLAKVEALFRGAAGPGERAAAAMDRLQGRLDGSDGDREPEYSASIWVRALRLIVAPHRRSS